MEILKYKKIFFWLSGLLVVFSLFFIFTKGLNLGIDFTGGSVLEFSYPENPPTDENIKTVLSNFDLGSPVLRHSDNNSFILRTKFIDEEVKSEIISNLSTQSESEVSVERFSSVGPTLGKELQSKALVALILVIILITIFIAYSFRHVSTPVSSWKYGYATMIALAHDIIITVGIFSFFNIEIDSLFITALLVILGYSINDTIVVFDRVRDNLNNLDENKRDREFPNVLNNSFNQTIVRSFNTSFTTLISLIVLYFIGIESISSFILALIIGIVLGTYSSIALAVPLLSVFHKKNSNIGAK